MVNRDENRSALILGGAGFIGANLARHLLVDTETRVHIFDNLSRKGVQHNLQQLKKAAGKSGRLRVTVGDVRDATAIQRVVRDATEIYQFAAQVAVTTSVSDPRYDFETNCIGTFNVLEAARLSGNRPFVFFTSTNKVYGEMLDEALTSTVSRYAYANRQAVSEDQPLDFHSPYGCSKGAADQYVREYSRMYGLPTVVFRMSCIAGEMQYGNEDQGWVAHFLYTALRGAPLVIYGDGRQVRDVLYVGDLVRAFDVARLSLHKTAGQVYNVGGGPENTVSLVELIDQISAMTGKRVRYSHERRRPGDQLIYVSDSSKLTQHTGWKAKASLRETLQIIYTFWREHPEIFGEAPASREVEAPLAAGLGLLERTA